MVPDTTRFLADAMLGRLARWLRVLGCDTGYDPTAPDQVLVDRARAEGRILLTRDRPLLTELRPLTALLITPDAPLQQLRQVVDEVGLAPPVELFNRCLVCNAILRLATDAEVTSLVPPGAQGLPGPVRKCPACARAYWPGSHTRRMRSALARTFPEWSVAWER
jgi:uncharacterized protein with PIN domain